jgi:hypothetical protein
MKTSVKPAKMTPEHVENQRLHCINRLKERFGLGVEDYWAILEVVRNGKLKNIKPCKNGYTWEIRTRYGVNNITLVYDSHNCQIVTVY